MIDPDWLCTILEFEADKYRERYREMIREGAFEEADHAGGVCKGLELACRIVRVASGFGPPAGTPA